MIGESEFGPELERAIQAIIVCDRLDGQLGEALNYCLFPGGKRIRPKVAASLAMDLGALSLESLLPAAVAIELCHTSSLIHDDLPALDDDDLRRGRPALHKAFPEAVAILTADFLIAAAFKQFGATAIPLTQTGKMLASLAGAFMELCDGQVRDLRDDKSMCVGLVNAKKTGALFQCAAECAGVVAGYHSTPISELGLALGLVFQATDDLLDGSGDCAVVKAECDRLQLAFKAVETETGKTLERTRGIAEVVINQLGSEKENLPIFALSPH